MSLRVKSHTRQFTTMKISKRTQGAAPIVLASDRAFSMRGFLKLCELKTLASDASK